MNYMTKLRQTISLALMLLLATGVQARTWTISDGAKTFEGDLQSYAPATGMVVVKQTDGNRMTLTFHQDKLSAADNAFLKEQGTKRTSKALFVHATDFARPAELSPCPSHGHHWSANAESYFLIGDAAGEGMKSLLKKSKTKASTWTAMPLRSFDG